MKTTLVPAFRPLILAKAAAILPAALLWLAAPSAHAQNLLLNPSFELLRSDADPVPNWTIGGNGAVTSSDEGGASDGVQEAIFGAGSADGGNTLTQTIGTTIGAMYHLSLDAAIFGDAGGSLYSLQIGVTDAQGGGTLANSNVFPINSGTTGNQYTTYTLDFTAASAATILTLTDVNVGDVSSADMIVDNTILTVPEPSTWAAVVAGVGLLAGATLRRRARLG